MTTPQRSGRLLLAAGDLTDLPGHALPGHRIVMAATIAQEVVGERSPDARAAAI
jgi:hypothetical protein